ncbi:hypothetical protein D3C87_1493000 [compost metagenome]
MEDLRILDDAGKRSQLDHADHLVSDRRHHDTHGLRQHDTTKHLELRHTDRAGGLILAAVNRQKTTSHDFRRVGTLRDAQTEHGGDKRRHDIDGAELE